MKKISTIAIISLALTMSSASAISIDDTLVATLANNPSIKAASARVNAQKANVGNALSLFGPEASFDYSVGRQDNDIDSATTITDIENGALTIDQTVFSGFGNVAAYKAAKLAYKSEQSELINTSQTILLQAATAHINVARDARILEASGQNERSLTNHLKATKARKKLGALTQTDVSQSRARQAEARADSHTSNVNLSNSVERYIEIVGNEPLTPQMTIPTDFTLKASTREELLNQVLESNPSLQASLLQNKSLSKEVTQATSNYLPNVFIRGAMERNHNSGTFLNQDNENSSVTLNVNVPLFRSGSTFNSVKRAKATYNESTQNHEALTRQITRQTNTIWEQLQSLNHIIQARRLVLREAKKALRGYRKEYEIGNRTTIDLLDAERDVFRAEIDLARTEADFATTHYQIQSLLGAISPASGGNY